MSSPVISGAMLPMGSPEGSSTGSGERSALPFLAQPGMENATASMTSRVQRTKRNMGRIRSGTGNSAKGPGRYQAAPLLSNKVRQVPFSAAARAWTIEKYAPSCPYYQLADRFHEFIRLFRP